MRQAFVIRFLGILVILSFIISCIPFKPVVIQVLEPSQIKLGTNYNNVEIHCEYCGDIKPEMLRDTLDRINATVSLNFLHSLKETLEKSPLFQNSEVNLTPPDSVLLHIKDYKSRINSNNLLIVLDSIYLNDTIIETFNKNLNYNLYTYGIIHKFGCKVYTTKRMSLVTDYLLQDTVFWTSPEPLLMLAVNDFPDLLNAVWDTGIKAGEKYGRYLAPYWVEQSRSFYYENVKAFKNAYQLIQTEQLDSAIHVLNLEAEKIQGNVYKAKILHNIAVTYELKNDFDKAYALIDSSLKMNDNKITKNYKDELLHRKVTKIALDWQLSN